MVATVEEDALIHKSAESVANVEQVRLGVRFLGIFAKPKCKALK